MTTRRKFITDVAKTSALAFLPFKTQALFADTPFTQDTIITAVDIIKYTGPYSTIPGVNRQPQIKPLDIYPALRPPVYKDAANTAPTSNNINHIYIRIKTKGGLEGFYGHLEPEVAAPVIQQLRPFLIGKDAMNVEALWDQMYRNYRHSRAGQYMMAISAVDNCLWDIRGKFYKTPVYELLGGSTRGNQVRVYGSCLSFSIEKGALGPRAKQLYDDGFKHQKWFMAYGPGDGMAGLKRSVEMVEELRGAVGDEAQIMFDAFMGWDLPFATQWCKDVEKFKPYWIEEAFPPDHMEEFVQLRQNTTIPVASGEHFYSRWEVLNYLKAGALQIIQADPEWCGGTSELVKICHLASAYGAKVFPHGHNIHSALHVVASQSPEVCPLVEYLIVHMPQKLQFEKDALLTKNGLIQLPTKPGFGIEIDETKINKQEVLEYKF